MSLARGVLLLGLVLAGLVGLVWGQGAPALAPVNDRLDACLSLLRVKQDMPCRCDQAEQLAASLLRRAEKAEADLEALKQTKGGEPSGGEAPLKER